MWYTLCKFYDNRARDTPLRGVYIPHFGQIWVKISILGSYTLVVAPMGVKFGTELLRAKFRCIVSPLRGEKPQNRPLSKLNTGRFALRAMLPVKISENMRVVLKKKRKNCDMRKSNTSHVLWRFEGLWWHLFATFTLNISLRSAFHSWSKFARMRECRMHLQGREVSSWGSWWWVWWRTPCRAGWWWPAAAAAVCSARRTRRSLSLDEFALPSSTSLSSLNVALSQPSVTCSFSCPSMKWLMCPS